MATEIEQTIITNVLNNPDYFGIVAPHLKQSYFQENKYKTILDMIYSFYDEYSAVPSYEALRIKSDKLTVDEGTYDALHEIINVSEQNQPEDNVVWLTNETEEFCKQQALYNALSESLQIKQNSELPLGEQNRKIPDVGIIPDLMKDALSIAFDSSVGHDYFGDAESRHESYNRKSKKFSFGPGLESLDKLTGGGVESGTLNLLLAPVNTGKSLGLCTLAAQYILQGYNVLYISMEMDEEAVAKRIDANILDISMDDLKHTTYKVFGGKLDQIKSKCMGSFKVKQYPTSNAGVLEFTALINELQLKQDWKPDIVLNDYLGITKSKRVASSDNTYTYQKIVSEELRGFATEYGFPVWSAVQTNRDAWGASDISMGNIADSAAVAATADFMLGIIETEELIAAQQQLIKAVKNRYGSKDVPAIAMTVDKDKQRWSDSTIQTAPISTQVPDAVVNMSKSGKMMAMEPDADLNIGDINWGL